MKILLINPPALNTISGELPTILYESSGYTPPLGILYLAACIEKYTNFKVKVLDCLVEEMGYEQLETFLKKEQPEVIGITALTLTIVDVFKTANLAKKNCPNSKIILGGAHVNIFPYETILNKDIDFLVLGEGEKTIVSLLKNINNPPSLKKTKGIVYRIGNKIINTGFADLITELDQIPFPARHLTPYKKYYSVISKNVPIATMITSRGCPFKCLFCDRPHLGKIFRYRTAKNIVDEIEQCKKMGIKEILIYDDTFTVNKQRVIDICKEIIKRKLDIPWDVRARVDTVDKEMLLLMKKAGCERIHYGVEAGTDKILKVLRKGITIEKVKEAFRNTKEAKIETLAYFMIGSPTETREDVEKTIKIAKELNPDYAHFTITTPFPGTDLYRLGLKQNIITHDYWQEFAKNPSPNFIPPAWEETFKKEELISLLKKAYFSFYFRPRFVYNQLKKITSFNELKQKAKAGISLLKI